MLVKRGMKVVDKNTKEYIQKLTAIIKSSYGYVKAAKGEGLTDSLLAEIETTVPEVLSTKKDKI